MTNDLDCQAVLSNILFCLTYEPSGRLQGFDYRPRMCAKQKHFCILAYLFPIQRLLLVAPNYFPSHLLHRRQHALVLSQSGALHSFPTTCRAKSTLSSAVPTRFALLTMNKAHLWPGLKLVVQRSSPSRAPGQPHARIDSDGWTRSLIPRLSRLICARKFSPSPLIHSKRTPQVSS